MKLTAIVLWVALVSATPFHQKGDSMIGFYCNVKAFTKEERVHYNELSAQAKNRQDEHARTFRRLLFQD